MGATLLLAGVVSAVCALVSIAVAMETRGVSLET